MTTVTGSAPRSPPLRPPSSSAPCPISSARRQRSPACWRPDPGHARRDAIRQHRDRRHTPTAQQGRNEVLITRRSLTLGLPLAAAASGVRRYARAADTSPIIIGYPAALTGPSSAPGVGQNRGVTYIVDQLNAAGGVNGRKIQ